MHGALTEAQLARPRDLSTLRTGLFAAGMKSATPVGRRGAEVLAPFRSVSGFGMTEVWLGVAVGSVDDDLEHRIETSGYPAPGYEIAHRRSRDRRALPARCVAGELQVRGFSLMLGYYKKPKPRPPRAMHARRLVPHRRHGASGARTVICAFSGATRTCSRSAARMSIRWRSRDCCSTIPEIAPGGGGGRAGWAPRRGRRRPIVERAPGGRLDAAGGHRLVPGQGGELQDSGAYRVHRRLPDDGVRQDSQGGAARAMPGWRIETARGDEPPHVEIADLRAVRHRTIRFCWPAWAGRARPNWRRRCPTPAGSA